MRVGLVFPTLNPNAGGAHYLTETLLRQVVESRELKDGDVSFCLLVDKKSLHSLSTFDIAGFEVRAFSFTRRGNWFRYLASTVRNLTRLVANPSRVGRTTDALTRVLDKRLQALKIDLVWFASLAPCPLETPYVATIYNLAHLEMPGLPEMSMNGEWKFRDDYYRRTVGNAFHVIASTEYAREQLSNVYPVAKGNISVIEYPVPLDVPRGTHHSLNSCDELEHPYFLYPAQFWPHKAHAVLVEAMALYQSGGGRATLVLVGSDKGNLHYIQEYSRALEISDVVEISGFVDRATLFGLYEHATALLVPSLIGPDGIPFLEAMAIGCPIVSGTAMGTRAWIGDAGRCVDNLDALAWAAAMRAVTDSPEETRAMQECGLHRAALLDAEQYVRKMRVVLNECTYRRRLWSLSQ